MKFKRKKLNNKGFTLIELLAVVVILAVVMGIAITSVVSSMNKSRSGSLSDSAQVVAQGLVTKKAEAMVDGTNSVLNNDLADSTVFHLTADDLEEFNLSTSAYLAGESSTVTSTGSGENLVYSPVASFVAYNATTEKFVVCLYAVSGGNLYVKSNALSDAAEETINGFKFNIAAGTMFACSDGDHKSWN